MNDRGRGYLARRQHALQRDTNGRYTQYWGPLCSEDGGADLRRIRNRNNGWLDPDTHVHWSTRAEIGSEMIAITVRTVNVLGAWAAGCSGLRRTGQLGRRWGSLRRSETLI
jgi:hypothetical protein